MKTKSALFKDHLVELRLFGVTRIGDEAGGEHVGASGNVGQRGAYHAAGAAFGDGDAAAGGAVVRQHARGKVVARGEARFIVGQQGSNLRKL